MPNVYKGATQAISAVGLAEPKCGVLPQAVQRVLVVCTMTEVG